MSISNLLVTNSRNLIDCIEQYFDVNLPGIDLVGDIVLGVTEDDLDVPDIDSEFGHPGRSRVPGIMGEMSLSADLLRDFSECRSPEVCFGGHRNEFIGAVFHPGADDEHDLVCDRHGTDASFGL